MFILFIFANIFPFVFGIRGLMNYSDYEEFRKSTKPHAIFYYHLENTRHATLKSKIRDVMKEAEEYVVNSRNYFMHFAMINCKDEDVLMDNIEECRHEKRLFFAYMDEKKERFSLQALYDVEAFLGRMLYFVYESKIGIAQSQEDWDYEQNQVKGKKDILLMYFVGLGTKEQYHFMNFASTHLDKYIFVYSTERKFAETLGLTSDRDSGMWYVTCSKLEESLDEQCQKIKYPGKRIDTSAISSFLVSWSLPLHSKLRSDGSYDFSHINRLFVVYDDEESKVELVKDVESAIQALSEEDFNVRAILINIKRDAEYLSDYGVYEDTVLPTILLEINDFQHSPGRELEPFTADEDINKDTIVKFVGEYLTNRKQAFTRAASIYNLQEIGWEDWETRKKYNLKILAGGCRSDTNAMKMCSNFSYNFRRLIRSLVEADIIDIDFLYIDFTGMKDSQKYYKIPFLYYRETGVEEKLDANEEEHTYEKMLSWISAILKASIHSLPLSGSDFLPLPAANLLRENEQAVDVDDNIQLLENDELAKDAAHTRRSVFYQDSVPILTDETFRNVVMTSELLVVFMYVPWDDRCYLFQPVYANIRNKLASDLPVSTVNTTLVKVNCYTQYQACVDQNVFNYPVIRFFMNGQHVGDYNDLLEEATLFKVIRLYQNPAMFKINHYEIAACKNFRHPMPAAVYVRVTLLAWFKAENDEDFLAYKSFAEKHRGKVLFAYATGVDSKKELEVLGLDHVGLQAFTRENDEILTTVFTGNFNDEELNQFLLLALTPHFGELTVSNFPLYRALGRPLLLVFTKPEDRVALPEFKVLTKLVNDLKLNVQPAWMNTELPVTKNIRRSYVGKTKRNVEIVITDHVKGEVYAFNRNKKHNTNELEKYISKWLKKYDEGKLEATSFLNRPAWKPLREGFDYLKFIKEGVPENDDYHNEYAGEPSVESSNKEGNAQPDKSYSFHGHKTDSHGQTVNNYIKDFPSDGEEESLIEGQHGTGDEHIKIEL